jgi:hypothetical protein
MIYGSEVKDIDSSVSPGFVFLQGTKYDHIWLALRWVLPSSQTWQVGKSIIYRLVGGYTPPEKY